jgi:predicted ribosome quality control (RQC) complex YloA/Tae2 family protein
MYVDAVTTAAVAAELKDRLIGGRVQDVLETGPQSIGLEVYNRGARHYLLMTASPQSARCHLVPDKLRRGVEKPSPIGLLMKKYVESARVVDVSQPPWERVLHFDFSGKEGDTRLIVETMDKRSNIVLTVAGDILDCIKRVGPDQNRYRVLLPGKPYIPPPTQEKIPPEQVKLPMLDTWLKHDPDNAAWRVLVANVAGVSPLLAREIVYFATGDIQAPAFDVAASMLYAAFTQHVDNILAGQFLPCVVPAGEEGYIAFAAYPLTHLDQWQAVESISSAMTAYFGAPVGIDAYEAGKRPIQEQIDDARERTRHKLRSLEQQQSTTQTIDMLRKKGELLFAYATNIRPGQASFRAQYDPDAAPLTIELDPSLSAVENAHRYFEKYEKAKRAIEEVPALIEAARREIEYIDQLATDLDLAESWPEIELTREALQEAGYWRGEMKHGPRGGKPGIRRLVLGDGYVVLIGRNAEQNHSLITEKSSNQDLWLHTRGVPGSHVIIKHDGRLIPEEIVHRAAEMAAYYSASRHDTAVEVDITERRYVRPIKGGRPGMVSYRNERTVRVRPQR